MTAMRFGGFVAFIYLLGLIGGFAFFWTTLPSTPPTPKIGDFVCSVGECHTVH